LIETPHEIILIPVKKMEPVLEVKDLVKNYGDLKAVDGISFAIPRGTCFGLLGPNGAGKTTALETIEDIKKPTSGSILYNSRERDELFREDVGIQFQETSLLSFLKVKETLETFMNLYSGTMKLDEVIGLCHLGEILDQFNDKISGGQKQRLLLALAMINDPELLFLDEPSTGMDPQNRRNMWEIIKSIKKKGKTIILTTHYMEEAEYLCDVVAIMDHGKIIAEGPPGRLVREYSKHVTVILPADMKLKKETLCGSVYELDNSIELQTDDINSCIQELLGQGIDLSDMTVRSPNLEDVFINLTGRRLRE
jgi:ABC-2 type transport system ATP-binding protein